MRDCFYKREESAILRSGIREKLLKQTKFIFSVHEKHKAKRRWSGCYCAGMKIISEAKLPIYKNPQWPIGQRGMSDC